MRPSAELRPPGVYPAMAEPVISPLQIADTKTAGFIGIAQKGPIDEPRRITSWDEFAELYGYTSESYLSDSIEAYFRNGGQACFVVRVAHVPRDDSHPGMEHAAAAIRVVKDDWNKPTLRISALNEGRWGNNIWVSFEHSTGATALLTQDLEIGVGEALVSSTRGFKVGQLVRLYDRENSDYVILTDIGERVLRWGPETPVNRLHRAASPTYLEVLSFELHVALKDRREVFKGLQMHPSSRQYAPRVIAAESRLVKLDDLKANSPPGRLLLPGMLNRWYSSGVRASRITVCTPDSSRAWRSSALISATLSCISTFSPKSLLGTFMPHSVGNSLLAHALVPPWSTETLV